MGDVFLLAFTAALNPTLLAATTVMLLLPRPKRLLLGYLLGAALTSVTLGLLIVYVLRDKGVVVTAQTELAPGGDLVLGCLALLVAFVLGTGRDRRLSERRRERKERGGKRSSPRWQQVLGRGSARLTFAVGAALTLPGASYIVALNRLAREDPGIGATVAAVLAFNLIMLALLEVPLVAYAVAPDWTPGAVARFRDALTPAAAVGRFGARRSSASS